MSEMFHDPFFDIPFDENHEYDAEVVRTRVRYDEMKRSIDEYYLLIDLMNNSDMMIEIPRLKKLLEMHPNDINLCVKLGITRRKLYDYNQNIPGFLSKFFNGKKGGEYFFYEVRKIDPLNIHYLYNTSKLFVNEKNEEGYLKHVEIMKKHQPTSPWTYFVEGFYLIELKSVEDGISFLESHLHDLKTSKITYKYGLINLSRAYKRLGKEDRAMEYLHMINETFVANSDTHYGLKKIGWYYIGQYENKVNRENCRNKKLLHEFLRKAEEKFLESLRMGSYGVYYSLGVVYEYLEDYDKAIEYHRKELAVDRYGKLPMERITDIYINQRKYENALTEVDKLIQLVPDIVNHPLRKSLILEKMENGVNGINQASEYLEDVLAVKKFEKKEDLCKIYSRLCKLCLKTLNGIPKSIEYANLTLETDPKCMDGYLNRGEAYMDLGMDDKAVEDLMKVINEDDAMSYEASHLLGWMYEFHPLPTQDYEKAIKMYKIYKRKLSNRDPRKISQIYPDDRISECYYRIGEMGRSYRRTNRLLKIYKDYVTGKKFEKEFQSIYDDSISRKEMLERNCEIHELLGGKGRTVRLKDVNERIEFMYDEESLCDSEKYFDVVNPFITIEGENGRYGLKIFKFLLVYRIV